MKGKDQKEGILFGAIAYIIWGVLPIYWKLLDRLQGTVILAHRIIWAFVFMLLLLFFTKRIGQFVQFIKVLVSDKKNLLLLFLAAVFITVNWGIYIWAVNANHILHTSLGYYINPLMSFLLAVIVLKERVNRGQILAFILAGCGVFVMTLYYGTIPWISLALAVTFAIYGLIKKLIVVDSAIGLTIETLMIAPFAVIYLLYTMMYQDISIPASFQTGCLLMGSGVVTAIPLLLFAKGAQKLPLSMLGFLQYIAPTITLFIGVFVYHEPFTLYQLLAFIFIWSAILLYSLSIRKQSHTLKKVKQSA